MQPDPVDSTKIENGRFSYGVASSPGKRASMEDFYEARIDDVDGEKVGMFGVYDGHGGSRAAEYVKQHLFNNLIKHPKFITDTKAAIAETYNHTDSEFLKADSRQTGDAGSTASTAIIVGDCLLVANVADSRAVISKGGHAIAVSRDHKPDQRDERQRIEDAGGFVMWSGSWRVGGVLAVSRAFGDKLLKQYVVADPEINLVLHSTNTKRNHVRKDILMLSRARNGGSSSEGIGFTLSGGNNHYSSNDKPLVILDNQSQVNCTGIFTVLSNLSIGPENIVLVAANKGKMETFMSGSVLLENYELHDVHYCPDLGDIIIVSGSKLDNDDYEYNFRQGKFSVKDIKNDMTVGEGCLIDGNYILDYLKIPRDRTRAPKQPGLVTTVWNAVCSALHRLGL